VLTSIPAVALSASGTQYSLYCLRPFNSDNYIKKSTDHEALWLARSVLALVDICPASKRINAGNWTAVAVFRCT